MGILGVSLTFHRSLTHAMGLPQYALHAYIICPLIRNFDQVPMSLNLLKAGYDVVVYNRNLAKCDTVVAAGGRTARSPREVAELSTYTFATLSGQDGSPSIAHQ